MGLKPMDMISVQFDFLEYCKRKNLSEHTGRAYRQDLSDFRVWIRQTNQEAPLTKEAIGAWISNMSERGLAPTTVKRRVACLKVFCRWLEDEEKIDVNPFLGFRTQIKTPKRLPKNLSRTELKALIGKRVKGNLTVLDFEQSTLLLALEILFATGIRVGELCSIGVENLDLNSGVITIKGKGNRERRVYLVDDELKRLVSRYLQARQVRTPLRDNLLVTKRGTAMTPNQIRQALHKHVDKVGLDRKVTPHMFRHTTATQLLENGVDIRFVQKLLGHASISTTEIYTHVSDVKLHEAVCGADLRRVLG